MLTIITGMVNANPMKRWFETTVANCVTDPQLVVIANGSTLQEEIDVSLLLDATDLDFTMPSHPKPLGTTKAFNWGLDLAEGDVVAVVQNDLLIWEPGWDKKLLDFFDHHPNAGVVGVAGAKQFAADDIYMRPYELQQLGRAYMYTSFTDWRPHGNEAVTEVPVACLDGVFIAFRPETGLRFDERFLHHQYDMDISTEAYHLGLQNYVLPLSCDHVNGQTANVSAAYAELVAPLGGDAGVHRRSHELMWEKWRAEDGQHPQQFLPIRSRL